MVYPGNMAQKGAIFKPLQNLTWLLQDFYEDLVASRHLEAGFPKLVEFCLCLALLTSL